MQTAVVYFKLDDPHSLELLGMKNAFEREVLQRDPAIILPHLIIYKPNSTFEVPGNSVASPPKNLS